MNMSERHKVQASAQADFYEEVESRMSMENRPVETTASETVVIEQPVSEMPAGARVDGAAQSGTAPQAESRRTLYRHPSEKMIGGVCGGLAEYFGWDPALVRVAWVLLTVMTSGGGLLAYLVLWGVLPVGSAAIGQVRPAAFNMNGQGFTLMAYSLITLGALWLLSNLGILPRLWEMFSGVVSVAFWPAVLVIIGLMLLRNSGRDLSLDWSNLRRRVKSEVGDKAPSREDVNSSLRQAREKFPLKRSRTDRIFMGVCGGIGRRLGVDANLVRLIWAAFSVGSVGMGVLIYILLGLFLPEEMPTELAPMGEARDVQIVDGTVNGSH